MNISPGILSLLLFAPLHNLLPTQETTAATASDPFAQLMVYDGTWTVKAEHPWGGGRPGTMDHLVSHCERLNRYFACEQTVNGKSQSLLVYTANSTPGKAELPTGRS